MLIICIIAYFSLFSIYSRKLILQLQRHYLAEKNVNRKSDPDFLYELSSFDMFRLSQTVYELQAIFTDVKTD